MSVEEKDKSEIVELALVDLRRLFDEISRNYSHLKNRVLGVVAGEVALVSFIFADGDIKLAKLTTAELVFFGFGTGALMISFGLLLWILATANWQVPLEVKESRKIYKRYESKLDWLEYTKSDYEKCIEYGVGKMRSRSSVFNKTLVLLSCGMIIMLVIRFTSQGG